MNIKKSLLVIDDDLARRRALIKVLEEDYNTFETDSCASVMDILVENQDEILMIFIDLQLLKKDNFNFILNKNQNSSLAILPIIVTSPQGNEKDKIRALNLGIRDFISAPYNAQAIKSRLKSLLSDTAQEKIKLIRDLTFTSNRLGALMNSIPGGIMIFKVLENDVLYVDYFNDKTPKLFGYTKEEFRDIAKKDPTLSSLIHPDDAKHMLDARHQFVQEDPFENVIRVIHKDGSVRWINLNAKKEQKDLFGHTVFVAVLIDVTKEKEFSQKLLIQDERDVLTGIYNKETFFKKTSALLKEHSNELFSFIRFDIDNFKVVNDMFGLKKGDDVLKKIADVWSQLIGDIGTYGRIESDNFAACIPSHLLNTKNILERIKQCFTDLDVDCDISISLGIYEIDDMTLPVDKMSDRAHLALKTIKESCSIEIAFYDKKIHDSIVFAQKLALQIQDALEKREFEIYLQPIYSISKQKTVSAEALIRWNHPVKGLLSSDIFIPISEKNGSITRLDAFMREEACRYLSNRQTEKKELFPISVNVSRLNIYDNNFCEDLIALVKKYDLESKYLKVEITESAYIEDPNRLTQFIEKLHRCGFIVMMDDFGSEYSSLKMLKDISVDTLKIDRLFIKDIETSARGSSILSSVIRIARWLGMNVIAEGVETVGQFNFLRSVGCDLIQGYYFSKPLPIKAFDKFLKKTLCDCLLQDDSPLCNLCDLDFIWQKDNQTNFMFNSMIGASGIYELCNNNLEIVRVNDSYYDLFGTTPELFSKTAKDAFHFVHENDRDLLLNACKKAQISHKVESIEIRRRNSTSDVFLSLLVNIRHLSDLKNRAVFYFTLHDITERKKIAEDTSMKECLKVLKKEYSEIFEIDVEAKTATLLYLADKTIPTDFVLQLDEALKAYLTRVHPEDKGSVQAFFDKLLRQPNDIEDKNSSLDYRIKIDNEYKRVTNTIFNFGYKLDRRIFVSCVKDINDQSELEKIRLELANSNRELETLHEKMMLLMDYNIIEMWDYNITTGDFSLVARSGTSTNVTTVINKKDLLNLKDRFSQESLEAIKQMIKKLENGESKVRATCSRKSEDGEIRWIEVTFTSFCDNNSDHKTMTGIVIDITHEKELRRLKESESKYKNYLTKNAIAFFECNLTTDEIITKDFLAYLGLPFETTLSEIISDYFVPVFYPTDRKLIPLRRTTTTPNEVLATDKEALYFEVRMRSKDGQYVGYKWRSVSVDYTINPITKHQHAFVYIRDIHKKKTEELLMRKKASHDPLTGLLDRVAFEELVTAALNTDKKSYVPGVFLIMDIDNFRKTNNTMGHLRGDEVIRFAAETLRAIFRSNDIIGRIGGDEMAVFMTDITNEELALRKGLNLCNVFKNWENKGNNCKKITCSVGVAMAATNNITFEELYDKADKALYQAKRKGKDTCCLYSEECQPE